MFVVNNIILFTFPRALVQSSTEHGLPDSDRDRVIESINLFLTQCLSVKHHTTTVLLHPQSLNPDPRSASVTVRADPRSGFTGAVLNHLKSRG